MAPAPSAGAPVSAGADSPGADDGGVPVTAGTANTASAAPRRIDVQVPGFALVLPLVAGAFYFFAFFAGKEPTGRVSPGAEHATNRGAPAQAIEDGDAPLADAESPRGRGFPTLVIEEPSPAHRRPLDGASPTRTASPAAAARTNAANARQLERARKEAEAHDLARMRERVDVVVYSTAWCPACRSLRDYLVRRGIRATEYDIEHNRSARARQRELNPRGGVPTVEIDGQVLVGFSAKGIEAALDRAARARLQRL